VTEELFLKECVLTEKMFRSGAVFQARDVLAICGRRSSLHLEVALLSGAIVRPGDGRMYKFTMIKCRQYGTVVIVVSLRHPGFTIGGGARGGTYDISEKWFLMNIFIKGGGG
jgi:hypothetical protein